MTRAQQNIHDFLSSLHSYDWTWDTCTSYGRDDGGQVASYAPTPEQLRDDGRIDGIPIRLAGEVRANHESSIREMEAFWEANPLLSPLGEPFKPGRAGGKPGIRIRCVETNRVFPNMAAAARAMGMNVTTFWASVRTGRPAAGYHWKRVKGKAVG